MNGGLIVPCMHAGAAGKSLHRCLSPRSTLHACAGKADPPYNPPLLFSSTLHVQVRLITRMLDEGMERAAGYGPIDDGRQP